MSAPVAVACALGATSAPADMLPLDRAPAPRPSAELAGGRPATVSRPSLLLGRRDRKASARREGAGTAQAFRFVDRVPGSARAVTVYVGVGTRARTVVAGLYSGRAGRPRSLLGSGAARVRSKGRWVTVAIRRTRVVRGRTYWVALLGTGGALETRGRGGVGCQSASERTAGLRTLPRSWRSGLTRPGCVATYVSGSKSAVTSAPVAPPAPPSAPPILPATPTGPASTPAIPPPTSITAPAISGSAALGSTLAASVGTWTGSPSGFAYQWQDCSSPLNCTNIAGASGSRYVVQSSDLGDMIDVVITATNAGGATAAVSPRTPAVASGGQSVAFWLAWSGSIRESQIPWDAVTQVDLFALTSTTNTSGCASDCTTLNSSQNGLSRMNVPGWVSAIHQQGKLAMVSIGGSTDQDWVNACAAGNLPGFADELVSYMVSNGFDGVDVDIESLQGSGSQLTLWASCVQAIAQVAHDATTAAGWTPIVSTDVDQSWMDAAVSRFSQWPDQFNLMYYGYPTGSYSCANSCSQVNALVQGMHNTGHVPYDEMVLGMSPGGNQAQCCDTNLATTAAGVDTSGSVSSIALSSGLSTALPAGNVVLASGENPPAHYQIFTTTGAAQGATSIPITGAVSDNGAYAFPSGSDVQSDYAGPWDCGNFARYAAAKGLEGVMIWDLQEEASEHGGEFPCFAQVAPYVASSP